MIQSFINNKQRIYTSVLLVTFRNSDYGKLARLNLNILILNITRVKLSETQAMPAPLQAFRKDVSCEYICFCPFIQSMVSFLFCMFSNLKPGPFLSLSYPWFLFPVPFFWHRQLYFLLSGFLLIYISLPYNCLPLIVFLSGLHIPPHQASSTPQMTFLVTTTSCLVPTALSCLSLISRVSNLPISLCHTPPIAAVDLNLSQCQTSNSP